MSGVCWKGEGDIHGYTPCAIETDHHKFDGDEKTYEILREECAELFADGGNQPEVCCSAEQLMTIQYSIQMMNQMFQNCPSCAADFREIYCHFSCAPNQNEFVEILGKAPAPIPGKEMITEVNYYVDKKFIQDLWDSCKISPITMQFTKMGSGCDKDCTIEDFLVAAGQKNPTTPYSIKLIPRTGTITSKSGMKYTPAALTPRMCSDGCDAKCGAA